MSDTEHQDSTNSVAILAMAGRFPGASDLDRFWKNLRDGVESITFFSEAELRASGVTPEAYRNPDYVRACGVLEGVDQFDAPFFGMSAREAALLDPQQRLFLECAWEAMEGAGYDSARVDRPVGVFAGESTNSYYFYYLFSPHELLNSPGAGQLFLGNDKDYLATRASYKLGLRGPSISVQTACSTSLVAVHVACQSLLNGECDMALAGGVSVRIPQQAGYFFQQGGILSPDGHIRAFDAGSGGSVMGSGAGVVLLKRLDDALADGDPIRAVIRGSAVNNDGPLRVGYTAPSVEGQSAAVAEALALARVDPESIGYVEAHGSGTPLGDPIEIAALTRAFSAETDRRSFCAVGSVKTNVGHLDAAAGIAGLIKTVLALEHRQIPPSLHFRTPNPEIDFASSPFFVNTALRPWEPTAEGDPRRAGVSSFGLGGTNAHVVLEEAPERAEGGAARPAQVVLLSAATPEALDEATGNLAAALADGAGAAAPGSLADVAYTLQVGRRTFPHRRALVVGGGEGGRAEARRILAERDPARLLESYEERTDRPMAFLLPGVGEHYAGMARRLYETETGFRRELDAALGFLSPILGMDLQAVLFPAGAGAGAGEAGKLDLKALLGRGDAASPSPLARTAIAQPLLFAVEVALGRLFRSWGIEPKALAGYSLGEYSAACLAGVFSLEDGARLVARRARLIEELPAGAMLAVPLSEAQAAPLASDALSLSAINGAALSVLAGTPEAVASVEARLAAQGIASRRIQSSHAFHSRQMAPIAERYGELVAGIRLSEPEIPYVSNVTGGWIAPEQATDPAYWVRHLLEPVRFGAGLDALAGQAQLFLEVGPGQSLSSLALQERPGVVAIPSLPSAYERRDDLEHALTAVARLWLSGAAVDWDAFHEGEERRRVPLPTYPFERRRCWVEKGVEAERTAAAFRVETQEPSSTVATTVQARPGLPNPYAPATTPTEEALVAIWEQLLGVSPIGVHDSFFDLGGHSLLAAQLGARLKSRFGVDLALAVFFEAPTVAGLAPRVVAGEGSESGAEPIPPRPDAERAPMSFAQQRLWFVERLSPGMSAYNNPMAVRLAGPLAPPVLEAALAEIARRHEILRTTFGVEGGEPVQRIAPFDRAALPPLPIADLTALPEARRADEGMRLVGEIVRRPFDLDRGPVRRAALLRSGSTEHLFVTAMHHILWDEWSQGIFVGELAALYAAFAEGQPSPLPPLPLQFGDFALWQRRSIAEGGALQEHLDYFVRRLDGAPRVLALPTDRPRPAMQTFRGGTAPFAVPAELYGRLAALAQQAGGTLFMLLLAAFEAVLSRYSGQDDLIVSSGVGGRPRVETESLIGCFINILLLRGELADRPSFRDFLRRTAAGTLADFAHQDVPFEALIEALQVERDPSTPPLAQVMLVFLNVPQVSIRLADLEVEGVRVDRKSAQFDLTFYLGEQGGTLSGHLEYNADLFDAATAERLLAHFAHFLDRAAADPALPVTEVPLLSAAERRQAVAGWNDTAVDFPDRPLHALFEERARERPADPALFCGEEVLSYGELDRRASRLAAHLAGRGVERGSTVGVSLRHGPEVAVALLAILKAGAAYVPLDPHYPEERLAYMLDAAGVGALVTSEELAVRLGGPQGMAVPVVRVDADREAIAAAPAGWSAPRVTPDDRIYTIFTSGSTGRPKGCVLDHRGRVNNFTDFNRRYAIGAGDRVLALSSLSFDMSAYDLLGTFAAGGAVVLPRPEEALEPASWAALAMRHRPTIWHSVPALLEMFLDALGSRGEALAELRLVLLGGDWIPVPLPDRVRAVAPAARVVSLGGATEVSMDSIVYEVGAVDPAWKSIPYGRPMANQLAYVVGPAPEPSPVGVAGELYLGGVGVGHGYAGRPELTAERFLPDPFAGELGAPGGRIYRTGDLARYGADGAIELLGRMDHQVKIRGYRIELGEILAAVRAEPGVADAVVAARDDAPGVKRLVAYVVAEEGAEPLAGMKERLAARLPAYMVPAAFVALPALPLTPNGKLDRKALPAPEAGEAREHIPPRTALERVLAAIWRDVLGRPEIGIADDFFAVGGHSLSATRVVTQVEESFPLVVPLRTLFEAPTLEGFAARLEALGSEAEVDVAGIAEVLLEVGELSEDEVLAQLAVGEGTVAGGGAA
jgi:amino acid adenylation domain-containing protein